MKDNYSSPSFADLYVVENSKDWKKESLLNDFDKIVYEAEHGQLANA